ncbi:MAG: DUF6035 family protein [Gammaproteobacteria bacterium]|nr:DUF6035 family protein [Gammaproteobacteria bacterium]
MAGNHNASPFAVDDPEIAEVLDMRTGSIIPAHEAIGSDYDQAMALRMELGEARARSEPVYVCPLCGTPVYLVSRKETRRFFFRHELEDGRCPAKTRGELNEQEINARKYNGAKESYAHIRMKQIIAESLRCDPDFSDVKVEAVWRGQERVTWRKPDVQAIYKGLAVAFEIQLSTTFLRVIAERRDFYQREGGLLCWVFKSYDEDRARLTQDDIFYSNNHNLFLASENTLTESRNAGRFMLDCRWAEPYVANGQVEIRWSGRIAPFDEFQLDQKRQRIFLFDYERAVGRARDESEEAAHQTTQETIRRRFAEFWINRGGINASSAGWKQVRDEWSELQFELSFEGMDIPDHPGEHSLAGALNALYSAREGRPVGWKFNKLIEVAHCVHGRHKGYLRRFRQLLLTYNRQDQIRREDREGKWQEKVKQYTPLLKTNDPTYEPDNRYAELFEFLFPELIVTSGSTVTSESDD